MEVALKVSNAESVFKLVLAWYIEFFVRREWSKLRIIEATI